MTLKNAAPPSLGLVFGLALAWAVTHQPRIEARTTKTDRVARVAVQESPLTRGARWDQRDVEGRWVWYLRSVRQDDSLRTPWIKLLEKNRDAELLEMIALYDTRRAGADALARMKARQWVRVHVFLLGGIDSHGFGTAKASLLSVDPPATLAWLEKYESLLDKSARGVAAELRGQGVKPTGDPDRYLPPIDPVEIFRRLSPPPVVLDIGDALRARPGQVYIHQIERELAGVAMTHLRPENLHEQMVALMEHPVPQVRKAVLLTWASVDRTKIPLADCERMANDADEDTDVRKAAVLAMSYSSHPRAWLALHGIATQPQHPGWRSAMSRLGGLGTPFSRRHIGRALRQTQPPLTDDVFVQAQLERMTTVVLSSEYKRARKDDEKATRAEIRQHLRRAAIAGLEKMDLAQALREWTVRELGERVDLPFVTDELTKLAASQIPSSITDRAERAAIVELAQEALDAGK